MGQITDCVIRAKSHSFQKSPTNEGIGFPHFCLNTLTKVKVVIAVMTFL
jgi:hypothetical protein